MRRELLSNKGKGEERLWRCFAGRGFKEEGICEDCFCLRKEEMRKGFGDAPQIKGSKKKKVLRGLLLFEKGRDLGKSLFFFLIRFVPEERENG